MALRATVFTSLKRSTCWLL